MGSRLWLLAPAAALYAGDVALTLAGQPADYWAGAYGSALEANPVAHPLLSRGPGLFVAVAAAWLATLSTVVVTWRHSLAGWVAVVVAGAHAVGGACWLTRIGPWGWVVAVAYLVAAAQASAWCWRHHGTS